MIGVSKVQDFGNFELLPMLMHSNSIGSGKTWPRSYLLAMQQVLKSHVIAYFMMQISCRASTFTRVNGSVSCLCNKRLQK